MSIEYEAKFLNINIEETRSKLKKIGANLEYPRFKMTKQAFYLPEKIDKGNAFVRVRKEYDKITLSYKRFQNGNIETQHEIELKIDSFEKAVEFIEKLGCESKSLQESYREKWSFDNCEITIDEWPYLEPYVEIEGDSEESVKKASKKLGFDYTTAYFGAADGILAKKYGISEDRINNHTPFIQFDKPNPYLD